jgi:hypothetical protein
MNEKHWNAGMLILPFLAAALTAGLTACRRDARLADKKLRNPMVKPVSAYGMTLDEQSSPKQVAFATLRAIRDDFLAPDREAREKALDTQFALCAANKISEKNITSLSREEWLYEVVSKWTPTVSHYVPDFPVDWEKAEKRLKLRGPIESAEGATTCDVLMEVDNVKAGRDPNARVVLVVWLVKDSGFWRVTHLGFDANMAARGPDESRRRVIQETKEESRVSNRE